MKTGTIKQNKRTFPLALPLADRKACGSCGRTLPRRSQWKHDCSTCAKAWRQVMAQEGGAA